MTLLKIKVAPAVVLVAVARTWFDAIEELHLCPLKLRRDRTARRPAARVEGDRERIAAAIEERPVVQFTGDGELARRGAVEGERAAVGNLGDRPAGDRAAILEVANIQVQPVEVEGANRRGSRASSRKRPRRCSPGN